MRTILRIAVCWVVFAAALLLSGVISAILHLPAVPMPGNTSAQTLFLMQFVAGLVLVVGLVPLARGLAASAPLRAVSVGSFILLALGVNGMIEAKVFTHFLDNGIASASVLYSPLFSAPRLAGPLVCRRPPPAFRIAVGSRGFRA
jgi:hypothetical protein